MSRLRITTLAVLFGILFVATGEAQSGRGKPKARDASVDVSVSVRFTDAERRTIHDYYAQHRTPVKPLPPGIAKNLARGKPLPPGIARQRLPADLTRRLPPRDGLEITVYGDRIVLLEASGLVVDVLADIF